MAKKKRIERKVVVDTDLFGKPIRKSFYGFTNREIDEKVRAYQKKILLEEEELSNITFEEYSDFWVETYKVGVVSDLTLKNSYYASLKILNETFGQMPIRTINQAQIQKFFNTNKWRNKWQVNRLHQILKAVFDAAIQNDVIKKSPVVNIRKTSATPKGKQAYTKEDYRRVLEYAKTHPDGIGPYIILKTGLRRGELCGLKWSDIDMNTMVLTVNRSITFEDGHPIINKGKTVNALRQIPIDSEFCAFLSTFNKKTGYVIGKDHKKPANPHNYNARAYARFISDLCDDLPDIPRLTLHELRHTYGTILYQIGTPLDTIADVMGHGDIQLTKSIYVHSTVEDARCRIDFTKIP
ncbi:Site-specific recombinase XerD [Eubacterium aggregans]|uniref:Site-specific recombinase XerD n=1 Tax=Eubacterium aggregans TaxID=81409 RepID=A0A1H3Y089_9FIRM|nr:site-specific integrase [Eubacterium aggregans]SEA04930.1 Site-specific recombinase XerD [Eubacterium aggregans]